MTTHSAFARSVAMPIHCMRVMGFAGVMAVLSGTAVILPLTRGQSAGGFVPLEMAHVGARSPMPGTLAYNAWIWRPHHCRPIDLDCDRGPEPAPHGEDPFVRQSAHLLA